MRTTSVDFLQWIETPLKLDNVQLRGRAYLRADRDPTTTEWRTGAGVINSNALAGEIDAR